MRTFEHGSQASFLLAALRSTKLYLRICLRVNTENGWHILACALYAPISCHTFLLCCWQFEDKPHVKMFYFVFVLSILYFAFSIFPPIHIISTFPPSTSSPTCRSFSSGNGNVEHGSMGEKDCKKQICIRYNIKLSIQACKAQGFLLKLCKTWDFLAMPTFSKIYCPALRKSAEHLFFLQQL